ncbi:DUF4328 domain-containing protein [Kitasatospora sp. NPDC057692]|uniref:DUF4328 domain-containing protein n=1 Tax=Kitasatospora sp. NPDC057692 TaxID=3346215 RepID=UPI00369F0B14
MHPQLRHAEFSARWTVPGQGLPEAAPADRVIVPRGSSMAIPASELGVPVGRNAARAPGTRRAWPGRGGGDLLLPGGHHHGSGWAVGACFTPVVGLWFPWRLTVDCWRANAPLVALWWAAWIGSIVSGRIAASMTRRFDPTLHGLESLRNAIRVEAAGSALRLVGLDSADATE